MMVTEEAIVIMVRILNLENKQWGPNPLGLNTLGPNPLGLNQLDPNPLGPNPS